MLQTRMMLTTQLGSAVCRERTDALHSRPQHRREEEAKGGGGGGGLLIANRAHTASVYMANKDGRLSMEHSQRPLQQTYCH